MNEEEIKTTQFVSDHRSFVDSIQKASSELNSIKTSFDQGMQDLGRIQNMLSLDGVTQMNTLIEQYEQRISQTEKEKNEAQDGARKFSHELEKEKDRLIKLWEAYKSQEEELATQEKRVCELEENLRASETDRRNYEDDANARISTLTSKLEQKENEAQEYHQYKARAEEYENTTQNMQNDMTNMQQQIKTKESRINQLEGQIQELKQLEDYVQYKTKYEELYAEYEKEKDRLAKLYHLYEDMENENKKLKEQITNWESWFNTNEALFDKLFSSVETFKTNIKTTPETPPGHNPTAPPNMNKGYTTPQNYAPTMNTTPTTPPTPTNNTNNTEWKPAMAPMDKPLQPETELDCEDKKEKKKRIRFRK